MRWTKDSADLSSICENHAFFRTRFLLAQIFDLLRKGDFESYGILPHLHE